MPRQLPIFLQVMLLASFAIRLAVGAPCCWSGEIEQQAADHGQAHSEMVHGDQETTGHGGHDDGDNTAGPCCSACGPILASADAPVLAQAVAAAVPQLPKLHELPQRDLLRLYEATGPPLNV